MQKLKIYEQIMRILLSLIMIHFFTAWITSAAMLAETSSMTFLNANSIRLIAVLGIMASLMTGLLKKQRCLRLSAFCTYVLFTLLMNYNFRINQLHYSFLAVTLLYVSFFHSLDDKENSISIKGKHFHSKFFMLALFLSAYSISGISKFFFDRWINGSVMKVIFIKSFSLELNHPLITDWSSFFWIPATFIATAETLSIPLFLLKKTRFLGYILVLVLNLMILGFFSEVSNLTCALIVVHLFLYHPDLFEHSYGHRTFQKKFLHI